MGRAGRRAISEGLAALKQRLGVDFTIVNSENASGGMGLTGSHAKLILESGVDCITLGDHAFDQKDMLSYIDTEPRIIRPLMQQLQSSGIPVLLMCEPQAHSLFPLASWQLCAPLDSVSAYDSYSSVNSLINLLANAFLHEILDKGRPRIHEIASLYQQLDELEHR